MFDIKVETIKYKDIEIIISLRNDNWGIIWSSYGRCSVEDTKDFIEALNMTIKRIEKIN